MNKRLATIKSLVLPHKVVADIGTDHALLPIMLLEEGSCEKVYACDVAKGPLASAQGNIDKAGLKDKIITILSDGLIQVPLDTQVVVIAGMGGSTACGILERSLERLPSFDQLLIQVNTEVPLMRKWLSEHECLIHDERMLYEGHYYTIMDIRKGIGNKLSEEEIKYGPILLQRRDPIFLEYLQNELMIQEGIQCKLPIHHPRSEQVRVKIEELKEIIERQG
ncbi:MAG: SAM-dependent methyltransferase [Erysipelotrichaceae bacterium]|nr:SAM-dependent methyltransferase [Erysipelotrichaceae bacterium]